MKAFQEKLKGISEYIPFIITLFFLFATDDSLLFGTNANSSFTLIKYILFYGVLAYLLIKTCNIPLKKKEVSLLGLFIALIVMSMAINLDFRFGYIHKISVILAAFLFCQIYSIEKFAYIYTKIMTWLVAISLVFEFCFVFIPKLANLFFITNVGNIKFCTWFATSLPVSPGGVIRNNGFAREPGVYAIFIILALIFETFVNKKKSVIRIILFFVGIISTLSTSGYISLAFYLITLLIYVNKYNFKDKKKIRVLLFLIILCVLHLALQTNILFGEQYGSVFGKMYSGNTSAGSFNSRLASIATNIYIGFQNILFGKGISYVDDSFASISKQLLNFDAEHNANTLLIHFAQYGIIFFFLQIYFLYKTMCHVSSYKIISFFCLITYIAVSMGETLTTSPIFFVMLFLKERDETNDEIHLFNINLQ
jgi:hypothetical protein